MSIRPLRATSGWPLRSKGERLLLDWPRGDPHFDVKRVWIPRTLFGFTGRDGDLYLTSTASSWTDESGNIFGGTCNYDMPGNQTGYDEIEFSTGNHIFNAAAFNMVSTVWDSATVMRSVAPGRNCDGATITLSNPRSMSGDLGLCWTAVNGYDLGALPDPGGGADASALGAFDQPPGTPPYTDAVSWVVPGGAACTDLAWSDFSTGWDLGPMYAARMIMRPRSNCWGWFGEITYNNPGYSLATTLRPRSRLGYYQSSTWYPFPATSLTPNNLSIPSQQEILFFPTMNPQQVVATWLGGGVLIPA